MFLYGSAGTGINPMLTEALKIKLSQLLSQGKRVKVLATTFSDDDTELQKNFSTKYLVNMENVEVLGLQKLCSKHNIEYDLTTPLDTMNRVTTALSDSHPDTVTLLLVAEVFPCNVGQTTPDWRDLEVRENVIWLLGLSPRAYYASSIEVLPPGNSSVLSRPLVFKQRNCPQIRNLSRPSITN